MKYSARLVTALAVIAFVAVTIVAAMVNMTTTAAKTVVSGVLTIGSSVTAGFVAPTGGVSFFHSSASMFGSWFASITRTLTTTRVSGAGREVKTTIPMHDMTQHRHLAIETNTVSAADPKNGFRRWLQWTIPFFAGRKVRLA